MPASRDSHLRVLVVDEHEQSRLVIAVALRLRGYGCLAVSSGTEALTALAEFQPHVLLLEWASRAGRRPELVTELRALAAAEECTLRIIVTTFEVDTPAPEVLVDIDAYLTKPFTFDVLEATICAVSGE